MRFAETVEQFYDRRFDFIDENKTIGAARTLLEGRLRVLIVTQNDKPAFVLDTSNIAGMKNSVVLKTITGSLDKVSPVTPQTELKSIKKELAEKTALVVFDEKKTSVMGTLSVYDITK